MLRYGISDRSLFAQSKPITSQSNLVDESGPAMVPVAGALAQARSLARSGGGVFLLREPDLPARDLAHFAREILELFRSLGSSTRLLLHTRADIAIATRAHGVHLPSAPGHLSPSHIRELYRLAGLPTPTVSLSCHTLDDVRCAVVSTPESHHQRPDLLLFGPVFEKRVRGELVQSGNGLALLKEACQLAAPTPVLALGGVTHANTPDCLAAGAAGVAGIRLFAPPETEASSLRLTPESPRPRRVLRSAP